MHRSILAFLVFAVCPVGQYALSAAAEDWFVIRENSKVWPPGTRRCFVVQAKGGNLGGEAMAQQPSQKEAQAALAELRRNRLCG